MNFVLNMLKSLSLSLLKAKPLFFENSEPSMVTYVFGSKDSVAVFPV